MKALPTTIGLLNFLCHLSAAASLSETYTQHLPGCLQRPQKPAAGLRAVESIADYTKPLPVYGSEPLSAAAVGARLSTKQIAPPAALLAAAVKSRTTGSASFVQGASDVPLAATAASVRRVNCPPSPFAAAATRLEQAAGSQQTLKQPAGVQGNAPSVGRFGYEDSNQEPEQHWDMGGGNLQFGVQQFEQQPRQQDGGDTGEEMEYNRDLGSLPVRYQPSRIPQHAQQNVGQSSGVQQQQHWDRHEMQQQEELQAGFDPYGLGDGNEQPQEQELEWLREQQIVQKQQQLLEQPLEVQQQEQQQEGFPLQHLESQRGADLQHKQQLQPAQLGSQLQRRGMEGQGVAYQRVQEQQQQVEHALQKKPQSEIQRSQDQVQREHTHRQAARVASASRIPRPLSHQQQPQAVRPSPPKALGSQPPAAAAAAPPLEVQELQHTISIAATIAGVPTAAGAVGGGWGASAASAPRASSPIIRVARPSLDLQLGEEYAAPHNQQQQQGRRDAQGQQPQPVIPPAAAGAGVQLGPALWQQQLQDEQHQQQQQLTSTRQVGDHQENQRYHHHQHQQQQKLRVQQHQVSPRAQGRNSHSGFNHRPPLPAQRHHHQQQLEGEEEETCQPMQEQHQYKQHPLQLPQQHLWGQEQQQQQQLQLALQPQQQQQLWVQQQQQPAYQMPPHAPDGPPAPEQVLDWAAQYAGDEGLARPCSAAPSSLRVAVQELPVPREVLQYAGQYEGEGKL